MRTVNFLFFVVIGFVPSALLGQLTISMDSIVYVCGASSPSSGGSTPVPITATISNGQPPYIFEWSCTPQPLYAGSNTVLHASTFLNDTTALSPTILEGNGNNGDSIFFRLKVADNLGNEVVDSILAVFSMFGWNTQGIVEYQISLGDSIWVDWPPNVGGGIAPYTYDWSPGVSLSDSTVASGFWAKPTETTVYTPMITDALGCVGVSTPVFRVSVNTASVNEKLFQTIKVSPNPTKGIFKVETTAQINRVEIYSITGKKVMETKNTSLDISSFQNGVYVVKVHTEKGMAVKKIVKE